MNAYILGIIIFICVGLGLYPLRKYKLYCVILWPILSISIWLLYLYCGSWSLLQNHQAHMQQTNKVRKLLASPQGMNSIILRVQQKLRQDPSDARGWFLLGRLLLSQEKWQEAHQALQHAYKLQPENSKILLNDARCVAMLHNQRLDKNSRKLLQELLLKEPQQPDALMLLAMDAYRTHHYQIAIDLWQELLKLLPEQSPEAQELRKAIAQAFTKMQN
jgi:cytochrome c-type biogenesis protein CcmH